LYLHEAENFVAADFSIANLSETVLEAEVWGERVDRRRHPLIGHVKAATYYLLQVQPTPNGWQGQVVVDV